MRKNILLFYLLFLSAFFIAQPDSNRVLRFDFNEHQIKENDNKIQVKPFGVSLTDDRFGNKKSALYVFGHPTSYLNLGSSDLLKSKKTTISMWISLQAIVYNGKGYVNNPLIQFRSKPGEDFSNAYSMCFNYINKRFCNEASYDSLMVAVTCSRDTVTLNTWYHLALTSDDDFFAFYLNGKLEEKMLKNFKTRFLEGDSVLIGRSQGKKNQRYTHAIFDDIRIYHRVLSGKEIADLYNEPNPNHLKNILSEIVKYGSSVLVLGIVIVILVIRNKRSLKRQKEYFELNNKITELELKVIRTQMNPHFISNSLSAIQNLIYQKDFENAGHYLARFSFFLRQVLDYSDKTYTTLEEELIIIKLNIELEQLRFKNNFVFLTEIDETIKLQDILIPSLITQPFIENAIWHGLLPLKNRQPRLTVRIYSRNKFIYIEIEDNGIGRSAVPALPDKNSKGTKLASDKIDNINKLRNSTDYILQIVDLFDAQKNPNGTKIIIELTPGAHEE